jgi:hypothetical protein
MVILKGKQNTMTCEAIRGPDVILDLKKFLNAPLQLTKPTTKFHMKIKFV